MKTIETLTDDDIRRLLHDLQLTSRSGDSLRLQVICQEALGMYCHGDDGCVEPCHVRISCKPYVVDAYNKRYGGS